MSNENRYSIIAEVNKEDIILLDEENLVPIKPICRALGITPDSQYNMLKVDDLLAPGLKIVYAPSRDKKMYKMLCLPLPLAVGWLFTIQYKNVKTSIQDDFKKHKLQCYHILSETLYKIKVREIRRQSK